MIMTLCERCGRRYPYEETAYLCCRKRYGCGIEISNGIVSRVCGESIKDGKFWFCKSCQSKKMRNWRTAKVMNDG